MKKGTVLAASVFDFIFAACLLAGAAVLFKIFFENWFEYIKFGRDNIAFFIIFFLLYIIGALGIACLFFGGVACTGLTAYYIAAGIKKIKYAHIGNHKKIVVHSMSGLTFASFACLSTILIAVHTLIKMKFGLIATVCVIIFVVSAINLTLNAIACANAKITIKNSSLSE